MRVGGREGHHEAYGSRVALLSHAGVFGRRDAGEPRTVDGSGYRQAALCRRAQYSVFVSTNGNVSLDLTMSYDMCLTQRLVLQPRLESSASRHDEVDFGIGRGLSNTAIGGWTQTLAPTRAVGFGARRRCA